MWRICLSVPTQADHLDAAVDYFSLALDDDPTHVKALRNRAIAYEQLDRFELAMDDLRDALRAAKNGKDTTIQAALQRDLDRVQDKYEEAEEDPEPDYDDDDDCYYDDEDDCYHYYDEHEDDEDEDGFGHPYNCGCHGYTAGEYARFFSETMKRGRSVNKVCAFSSFMGDLGCRAQDRQSTSLAMVPHRPAHLTRFTF